jgi:hypothetical protein
MPPAHPASKAQTITAAAEAPRALFVAMNRIEFNMLILC